MIITKYDNFEAAFLDILKQLLENGEKNIVRGVEVLEIGPVVFTITKPQERIYILSGRKNNIFGTIAETLWVLKGLDDLKYLSFYLPRVYDFSDDGMSWRGAYGPRLRNWYGIDQFKEIIRLLRADKNRSYAVMNIFDPAKDYVNSLDIPCNNWLHFRICDTKLHLNIASRSGDIIWGFSGINTFEWSVLQEMVAYWTNTKIGHFTYFISTLKLYNWHYDRAKEILTNNSITNKTLYDFNISRPQFSTNFEKFDQTLDYCFTLENQIRNGIDKYREISKINDEFLMNCLLMLDIYCKYRMKFPKHEIIDLIESLPEKDFKIAAIDYFMHKKGFHNIKLNQNESNFYKLRSF